MLFGWCQNFFKSLVFMTVFRLVFNIVKNEIVSSSLSFLHLIRPRFRRPLLFLILVFTFLLGRARGAVRSGPILVCVWWCRRAVGWAVRSPCLGWFGVWGKSCVLSVFAWSQGAPSVFLGVAGLVLSCAYCRLVLCFLGLLLLPFRSLCKLVPKRAHVERVLG